MKAQLIYNPVAGPHDVTAQLQDVVAFLESQGWEVILRHTRGQGDATAYAREAVADRCDMVVAVGGDGTLNEVAAGLVGSQCALGVLPVGTGNVWAHMVGLPPWTSQAGNTLLDAARVLVEGRIHSIDMGKAGDRYFVLWSGVGFDAQLAQEIEPHREIRRSFGNLTYYGKGLAMSLGLRGTRMTIAVDGRAMRARVLLIVVTNAQLYGSSWQLAPQARLDDGFLEVYVFKGGNTLDAFRHLAMILMGKARQDSKVETYRAKRVEIRGQKPLPLHVDGNPAGYTPVRISIVPKALRVIVPPWVSGSLFKESPIA